MSFEDSMRRAIEQSELPEGDKNDLREMMASHLTAGQKLVTMGMFREAIAEYEKEHMRLIKKSIDAEIVRRLTS